MAELIFSHAPNRITVSAAPGGTAWTALALPAGLPPKSGLVNVTVGIAVLNAALTGNGSAALVDFDKAVAPTIGFPVVPGQVETFGVNNNIWYKLGAATDVIYFIFAF